MTGFELDNFLAARAIEKMFKARLVRKGIDRRISTKSGRSAAAAREAVRDANEKQAAFLQSDSSLQSDASSLRNQTAAGLSADLQ